MNCPAFYLYISIPFCSFASSFSNINAMRKIIYLLFIIIVTIPVISCSEKKEKQEDEAVAFQIDSVDNQGVQRMQTSKNEQTVKLKGKDYTIYIERAPNDSLPRVKSDGGDVYVDNQITLRVTRNKGEKVFSKIFTKQSFSSLINAGFLSKSILEGMVFDKVTPNGLVFATSVSFPQTDLYMPLSITISADGKMSMVKEELMEETYTSEE